MDIMNTAITLFVSYGIWIILLGVIGYRAIIWTREFRDKGGLRVAIDEFWAKREQAPKQSKFTCPVHHVKLTQTGYEDGSELFVCPQYGKGCKFAFTVPPAQEFKGGVSNGV